MIARIALTIAVLLTFPAMAQELRVDVSQETIKVTTGFDGANITVFGTQSDAGDLVLVVEGPMRAFTVREKDRRLGLWTNVEARTFPEVPSFYEIATVVPLKDIAHVDVLRENNIGIENLTLRERRGSNSARVQRYRKALVQSLQDKHLYADDRNAITMVSPSLFKAEFALPAVVTSGRYGVYAYLFRDGKIIGHDQVRFEVQPEGISADIKRMSQNDRLLYGIFAVIMAMTAGWLATVLLKRD